MSDLLRRCICGRTKGSLKVINGIDVVECQKCGVQRQRLNMTVEEYGKFYDDYHDGDGKKYYHTYQQDYDVAEMRLQAYKVRPKHNLLDVGCGNGAFVDAARKRNVEAWGCDVSPSLKNHEHVYADKFLEDVHFPTDHFSIVTMHDVLEHLIDPIKTLKEIFRIVKQKGRFLLDFPRFHVEQGKHHWKKVEHLWMFDRKQLTAMLEKVGFQVDHIRNPIESKLVFYCVKPVQKRVKILVPPGIGDIYWSMVKIRSFCEKNKLGLPDVYISSFDKSKDRSIDYVRSIPFVNAAGYVYHTNGNASWKKIWAEAYHHCGKTIFENVEGCDYFIAYNGILRHGKSIADCDTQYDCEWHPPMFYDKAQEAYGKNLIKKYGEYFVGYFVPHGMYKKWLSEFPNKSINECLSTVNEITNNPILLTGAGWDKDKMKLQAPGIVHDLIGETTFPQLQSLLKNASGTIGFPSGLTFMSVLMGTPTFCFWNNYFPNKNFWWECVPPDTRETLYNIIDTRVANPIQSARRFIDMVRKKNPIKKIEEKIEKTETVIQTKPIKKEKSQKPREIKVVCVLRTGGDFDEGYVEKLFNMVSRNCSHDYEFVCLTNSTKKLCCDRQVKLKHKWEGFWSKVELFRSDIFDPNDQIIYFDLDTVILGSIDNMIGRTKFRMLQSFRQPLRFASGIMSWRGDWSDICEQFLKDPEGYMAKYKGDQEYIQAELFNSYSREPGLINERISIVSYKKHCTPEMGAPKGTDVICFHGDPRPHVIKQKWMDKVWV